MSDDRTLPEQLPCPECSAPAKTPHAATCRTHAVRVAYFADLAQRTRRTKASELGACWACDAPYGHRHLSWCPDLRRDPGGVYRSPGVPDWSNRDDD